MAISRGPKLVTNGLVFCVDAADKNSYIGSGTTWTDVSGNAYNGTLTNGPTFNGSNGGGIVFDGVDDYADLWYHLVATGANGSQKTYINGVQAGSNTIALSPSANSNSLVIGKLAYAGLYANMTMGCARIYNRALTASEIQQNYNSTKPRFGL